MIYVNPGNMVVFQWRSTDGGDCTDVYSPGDLTGTVTVKLVRSGNDFSRVLQHRRRHVDAARHDPDDRDGRHDPGRP